MDVRRPRDMLDIDLMVDLGEEVHAESRHANLPYDKAHLRQYGRAALANERDWCAFLAVDGNGDCAAMLALYRCEHLFTPGYYFAQPLFLSSRATSMCGLSRAGAALAEMVDLAEVWAAKNRVTSIDYRVEGGIQPERSVRFLARMGYRDVGAMMVKEIA